MFHEMPSSSGLPPKRTSAGRGIPPASRVRTSAVQKTVKQTFIEQSLVVSNSSLVSAALKTAGVTQYDIYTHLIGTIAHEDTIQLRNNEILMDAFNSYPTIKRNLLVCPLTFNALTQMGAVTIAGKQFEIYDKSFKVEKSLGGGLAWINVIDQFTKYILGTLNKADGTGGTRDFTKASRETADYILEASRIEFPSWPKRGDGSRDCNIDLSSQKGEYYLNAASEVPSTMAGATRRVVWSTAGIINYEEECIGTSHWSAKINGCPKLMGIVLDTNALKQLEHTLATNGTGKTDDMGKIIHYKDMSDSDLKTLLYDKVESKYRALKFESF